MLIESPNAISYFMAIVISDLSVNILEIRNRNVYDLDLNLQNRSRSKVNVPTQRSKQLSICLFRLSSFARYSRVNFSMYSIRIFDIENEVKDVDDLDEN